MIKAIEKNISIFFTFNADPLKKDDFEKFIFELINQSESHSIKFNYFNFIADSRSSGKIMKFERNIEK